MVVFAPPLLAASLQAGQAHQPAHPPPPADRGSVEQLPVHPGRAVGAIRIFVDPADLLGQLGFGDDPGRGDLPLALVLGGTGDLEHVAAVLHTATFSFLHLDETVQFHRVSTAKNPRLLLAGRPRKVYPRKSKLTCSAIPQRFASLQNTTFVMSGAAQVPPTRTVQRVPPTGFGPVPECRSR